MPTNAKTALAGAVWTGNNLKGSFMVSQLRGVSNNPTPIYANGVVIGQVVGDVFRKTISGSRHMLKRPPAICFDRATLRDAAAAGAVRAEIYDRESGTTYAATLATIDAYAFTVRRGHGDQVGLTLDHWSINGAVPVAEQRAAATNQAREDWQMTLFGEMA